MSAVIVFNIFVLCDNSFGVKANADDVKSVTYRDNIIWEFDTSTGSLTIGGTGDMEVNANSYNTDEVITPWNSYLQSIKKVVINDGVTSIGVCAFKDCTNLVSISIPNSVRSIGSDAFYKCRKLNDISIPNSVDYIGFFAFSDCDSLESVTLPCSAGWFAFAGCDKLKTVVFTDGVKRIYQESFISCYNIRSITVPKSLKGIGKEAFLQSYKLTDVFFKGTKEEWKEVEVEQGNISINNANIHFNGETGAVKSDFFSLLLLYKNNFQISIYLFKELFTKG